MGDWKSSAIGGSDAKVMKSGVSKCTCLRSYRGGTKEQVLSIRYLYGLFLCDPMWSTGTRLFCTPRFYSSGSVNQKVEPEPFYRVDPDCLVQTLDDGPTDRLPEYSAFEIY